MKKISKTIRNTKINKPTKEQIEVGLQKILDEQLQNRRFAEIKPLKSIISDYIQECSK
jgi:hypothetical protein